MAWKDKEKEKAWRKAYRQENKEKLEAYQKDYQKDYYQENKEKVKVQRKAYYQENKDKAKAYYQENKEKVKAVTVNNKYKRMYGITLEQKMEMIINQDSKCVICGEPFLESENTCIDHSHKTGKIRGILCRKCNAGLGQFRDDINILRNALEYLEKNGG